MSTIEDRLAKFMVDAEAFYDRVMARPWFSYALVSALQMKVLWNIWRYRDLTTGDTTSYFRGAYRWYESLEVNIVWSPLYTAFYGTVYAATQDVYVATIFHRVIIVMVATLGILALMRRLLPPALALIIAVWWALLPINFETLYEVHLFALLPILAAWLVVSRRDTAWRRGTALGILLATTVLVRNETIVAWGLYAVICLVREIREHSRGEVAERRFWHSRAAAYGIPAIVAIGTCAAFYWRSHVKYPEMMAALHAKHSLNMCQVFAFSYSQRHPDWTLSPWVECGGLVKNQFGYAWPTVAQMITNNPAAALEHFLWNVSLTLNGFQVSLFNAMSGTVNPDYAPVKTGPAALLLSLLAITMVAAAAIRVFRNWADWRPWFNERRGLWLIMFTVMCVAVPTIITQRPRPSYLFASTAVLMAIIGTAAHVLCPPGMRVTSKFLAVVVVPILVLAIPSHYSKRAERLLYTGYERLLPFRDLLAQPENRILFGDYSGEYAGYLRLNPKDRNTLDYGALQSWQSLQPLNEFLDSQGINVLFVQPRIMPELRARSDAQLLLDRPETVGWQRIAPASDGFSEWILLYKAPH